MYWPNLFSHVSAFNYNGHWLTSLHVKLFYNETRACSYRWGAGGRSADWRGQYRGGGGMVRVRSPHSSINHIATITGPRPTHGGYPPPALHQPTNHPQTNNSAYPRALKRGGRKRRTPPTTTITDNTSTRTQTIKSGQLTLLNLPPRHQNYTTPPHHRVVQNVHGRRLEETISRGGGQWTRQRFGYLSSRFPDHRSVGWSWHWTEGVRALAKARPGSAIRYTHMYIPIGLTLG